MEAATSERRTPRRILAVLTTFGVLSALVALAPAAGAAVTKCQAENLTLGTKASPNLAGLISAANPGNTIQVKGICTGVFVLAKDVTLVGKATKAVPSPALDGGYVSGTQTYPGIVVIVKPGVTATVRDLTIQHGAYPCIGNNDPVECDAGGVFNYGALTLSRVTVQDNVGSGVGNYAPDDGATMSITDSTITGNHAEFYGGGILTASGAVVLTRTVVTQNKADLDAGGISVAAGADSVTLNDSTVTNNSAGDEGGGIWNGASLILNGDSSVAHNTAVHTGGGIFNFKGTMGSYTFDAALTMNDSSEVANNIAGTNGGGIGVSGDGTVTLNDSSSVSGNSAGTNGGGIDGGDVTLNGSSSVTGNRADFDNDNVGTGGGIYGCATNAVDGGNVNDNYLGSTGTNENNLAGCT